MTDNEIIKALECCNHNHVWQKECFDCEYATFEGQCGNELIKDSLDLINRQKAEIEKLKLENRVLSQNRITMPERLEIVNNARDKAIREFAKKLKKKISTITVYGAGVYYKKGYILPEAVDNLVKEMTEGKNG